MWKKSKWFWNSENLAMKWMIVIDLKCTVTDPEISGGRLQKGGTSEITKKSGILPQIFITLDSKVLAKGGGRPGPLASLYIRLLCIIGFEVKQRVPLYSRCRHVKDQDSSEFCLNDTICEINL
jgi:hypothetical protein